MNINNDGSEEEDEVELQMTGMIDVVFLLLIFFIVTMKIPRTEAFIETRMPQVDTKQVDQKEQQDQSQSEFEDIHLALKKEGGVTRIYVNNEEVPSVKLLMSRFQTLGELNPEGRVVISCDPEVPYNKLVRSINAAQLGGLDIGFTNL